MMMMAQRLVQASEFRLPLRAGSARVLDALAAFHLFRRFHAHDRFEVGMRLAVMLRPRSAVRSDSVQLIAQAGVAFHAAVVFFLRREQSPGRNECAHRGMIMRGASRLAVEEERIAPQLFDPGKLPGSIEGLLSA